MDKIELLKTVVLHAHVADEKGGQTTLGLGTWWAALGSSDLTHDALERTLKRGLGLGSQEAAARLSFK